MAESKTDQDPTMEEILQSIKRIIAEDGDAPSASATAAESAPPAPPSAVTMPTSAPAAVEAPHPAPEGDDDDVLELTEVVQEQDVVTRAAPETSGEFAGVRDVLDDIDELTRAIEAANTSATDAPATDVSASVAEESPIDRVMDSLLEAEVVAETEIKAEEFLSDTESLPPEPQALEEEIASFDEVVVEEMAELPAMEEESPIVSGVAARATTEAFQQFIDALPKMNASTPSIRGEMTTRTGTTVEELLMETMKPLLKGWLEEHLPAMIERIVHEELRRLIPR